MDWTEPGLKRARYVDWRPSEEEAGLIRARTRIQACGGKQASYYYYYYYYYYY
jgi:hypothetical protein